MLKVKIMMLMLFLSADEPMGKDGLMCAKKLRKSTSCNRKARILFVQIELLKYTAHHRDSYQFFTHHSSSPPSSFHQKVDPFNKD